MISISRGPAPYLKFGRDFTSKIRTHRARHFGSAIGEVDSGFKQGLMRQLANSPFDRITQSRRKNFDSSFES
jgi:hypothetical protein